MWVLWRPSRQEGVWEQVQSKQNLASGKPEHTNLNMSTTQEQYAYVFLKLPGCQNEQYWDAKHKLFLNLVYIHCGTCGVHCLSFQRSANIPSPAIEGGVQQFHALGAPIGPLRKCPTRDKANPNEVRLFHKGRTGSGVPKTTCDPPLYLSTRPRSVRNPAKASRMSSGRGAIVSRASRRQQPLSAESM